MDALRAPVTSRAPAPPTSPPARSSAFTGFAPSSFLPKTHEEDSTTAGPVRRYSTSPNIDRRSGDTQQQTDMDSLLDSSERSTPPASALLLRNLPSNMSREALNSMLIFASDLLDAQFVSYGDRGCQTAVARFSTFEGALEVRNRLHGKPSVSGEGTMIVEVLKGMSPDQHRRQSDAHQNRHLSTSASSAGSSNGHTRPSRFSTTFQSMDNVSPTKSSRAPGPIDLAGTGFSAAQMQGLFSPTSPMGFVNGDRHRVSGKSIIRDDTPDDETRDLLQNPLAYAEAGHRSGRSSVPYMDLANLRLDTGSSHTNFDGQVLSPGSTAYARNQSQPMQSPGSELSQNFAMSPMSPSGAYPGSPQQYQRHQFPPANPADQNPPCNTLYVGNLPMDTVEEELKDLFSKQRGYKRLCFRTKHNGPMCFVEFEDVSFATKALNELYGSMLSNSVRSGIRLSFSKNPLGVRTGQANMHSPMTSPTGPSHGPPGFSTANGPPPGLSAPPGLNGTMTSSGMDGNHNNHQSYSNPNGPSQPGMNNANAFYPHNFSASYMPSLRSQGAYHNVQNGFPDIMARR